MAVADEIASLPVGQAAHADAAEENKRLLYVSMTRARDLLVFARQAKKLTGEWMDTVALGEVLPNEGQRIIKLPSGTEVHLRSVRWVETGSLGEPSGRETAGAARRFGH